MAFNNPMVFFLVCIAFVSGIGITPQSECSIIFSYSTFTCSFIVNDAINELSDMSWIGFSFL